MENKMEQPPAYYSATGYPNYPIQNYQSVPYPQPQFQQQYPQPSIPTYPSNPVVLTQPVVVLNGGCPRCGVGMLNDDYGCCAITMAILFFPLGVLCCLAMRERRCTN
ncbi:unnamed protein product, partial [Brachionus calyciflorus]